MCDTKFVGNCDYIKTVDIHLERLRARPGYGMSVFNPPSEAVIPSDRSGLQYRTVPVFDCKRVLLFQTIDLSRTYNNNRENLPVNLNIVVCRYSSLNQRSKAKR